MAQVRFAATKFIKFSGIHKAFCFTKPGGTSLCGVINNPFLYQVYNGSVLTVSLKAAKIMLIRPK
jgi:hypothetical protein